MIGSGDRDRQIVITPQVVSKGRAGGILLTAGVPIYEWAKRKVAKQETRHLDATQTLFAEVVFEINYRDDIDVSAHVTYDGTTFDVVHIAETGYKDTLQIYCRSQGVKGKV